MDDINKPETEEDGQRAGALRLLKVRRQYQGLTGRNHALLPSQSKPTLVLPEDPMHQALTQAQAKMTPDQRLAFLKKLSPPT